MRKNRKAESRLIKSVMVYLVVDSLAKVFFGRDDYEEFTFTESGTFFVADKESEADLMMVEDETEMEIPSLWTQSCTEENTTINYIIKN